MGIRYIFGPKHSGTYTHDETAATTSDPVATLGYKSHVKASKGKIHLSLSFAIPSFDASIHNAIKEVHVAAYQHTEELPTDPAQVVNATDRPKTSVTDAIPHDGTELVVTLPHVPAVASHFVSVLGVEDPSSDPAPAAPADPAPAAPADPAPVAPASS